MLRTYLMENYGYNEPIFLNDLSIEGLSENAVRQSVKRLVASGFLERYDNGIYYIPKRGGLLEKSYLDPSMVIRRKYVENQSNKCYEDKNPQIVVWSLEGSKDFSPNYKRVYDSFDEFLSANNIK